MARLFKKEINFLKHRRIFFIVSLLLIVATLIAIPIRGLNFGIEFVGGTSIEFKDTGDLTIEEMREQVNRIYDGEALIQTTSDARAGTNGFMIRIATTDAQLASGYADALAGNLQMDDTNIETNTIGPGWGAEVTRSSIIALVVAMALIILYIAVRFEPKMALTAILTLVHDLLIIVGVYAIFGREVTPNVIAALLTIMGYSLYDTVVVFHRIKDNMGNTASHSFMTVANHSINQVLIRTINTSLSTLIPVVAMLIFGGETLQDFAFAMTIGLILGSYSSIFIATPLYALWKQREPKYRKLAKKYGEGLDEFSISEQLEGSK